MYKLLLLIRNNIFKYLRTSEGLFREHLSPSLLLESIMISEINYQFSFYIASEGKSEGSGGRALCVPGVAGLAGAGDR